jgi:hypothetical protein
MPHCRAHVQLTEDSTTKYIDAIMTGDDNDEIDEAEYASLSDGFRTRRISGRLLQSDGGADSSFFLVDSIETQPLAQTADVTSGTKGNMRALYVMVDFSDSPGQPVQSAADFGFAALPAYFTKSSYGKMNFLGADRPSQLYRADNPFSYYLPNNENKLHTEIMAKVKADDANLDCAKYRFCIIEWKSLPLSWTGLGSVNGKFIWINLGLG